MWGAIYVLGSRQKWVIAMCSLPCRQLRNFMVFPNFCNQVYRLDWHFLYCIQAGILPKNWVFILGLLTNSTLWWLHHLVEKIQRKTNLAPIIFELFGETRELLNDRSAQIFRNHLMLSSLIAKLIEEVLVSLEASEPAKTNRVLFHACHSP